MRRTIGITWLLVLTLVIGGCSRHNPMAPQASAPDRAVTPLAGHVTEFPFHMQGSTGPHSIYSIDVPRDWNGDLVLYAHGLIIPPSEAIGLPKIDGLRQLLLDQGYAFAASSWDENGYAVKDAAQRTHQLEGLFVSKVGQPKRTYLMGKSIGGLVVEQMVETWPDRYAGVVTQSGVMGGTLRELDYVGTARVLFDCMYQGVLPGTLYATPDTLDIFTGLAPIVVAAVTAHPEGVPPIVALLEGRLPGRNANEYVTSLVYVLGFQIRGANDLTDRTRAHGFFGNAEKVYSSPYVPQPVCDWVNAHVARYTVASDAVAYLHRYYEPTGQLHVPMLSIHNEFDPVVPAWNETRYAQLVAAAGHSDMLLQRIATGTYGHTNFTDAEFASAFHDLTTWVETGIRPAL